MAEVEVLHGSGRFKVVASLRVRCAAGATCTCTLLPDSEP